MNKKITILGKGEYEIDKDRPVKRNKVSKDDVFLFPLLPRLVRIVDDVDCLFECKEWDMYELAWKDARYGKAYFERTMKYASLTKNQKDVILKNG